MAKSDDRTKAPAMKMPSTSASGSGVAAMINTNEAFGLLQNVIKRGSLEELNHLLNHLKSFSIDFSAIKNKSDITPVHIAVAYGKDVALQILIDERFAIDLKDDSGNSPCHVAASRGFSRCLEILVENGANVFLTNKENFVPLHFAVQFGHNQCARILLKAGCFANIKNVFGDTALHTAARYGHYSTVKLLLASEGCCVNALNKNGDTCVHISVAQHKNKIVKLLLENGCDHRLKNAQEETALMIAQRKGFTDVEQLIFKTLKRLQNNSMSNQDAFSVTTGNLSMISSKTDPKKSTSSARSAFKAIFSAGRRNSKISKSDISSPSVIGKASTTSFAASVSEISLNRTRHRRPAAMDRYKKSASTSRLWQETQIDGPPVSRLNTSAIVHEVVKEESPRSPPSPHLVLGRKSHHATELSYGVDNFAYQPTSTDSNPNQGRATQSASAVPSSSADVDHQQRRPRSVQFASMPTSSAITTESMTSVSRTITSEAEIEPRSAASSVRSSSSINKLRKAILWRSGRAPQLPNETHERATLASTELNSKPTGDNAAAPSTFSSPAELSFHQPNYSPKQKQLIVPAPPKPNRNYQYLSGAEEATPSESHYQTVSTIPTTKVPASAQNITMTMPTYFQPSNYVPMRQICIRTDHTVPVPSGSRDYGSGDDSGYSAGSLYYYGRNPGSTALAAVPSPILQSNTAAPNSSSETNQGNKHRAIVVRPEPSGQSQSPPQPPPLQSLNNHRLFLPEAHV